MTTRSILRVVTCLTAFIALGLLSGCSSALVGTWKADAAPEDAGFYIKSATFKDNGDFVAAARKGDETVRLAGTYEFDGMTLRLKTPGKQERTYPATYLMVPPTLRVTQDGQTVDLKKQ